MTKQFVVYVMASAHYGYLYVGVTSNLPKRVSEHKQGFFKDSFTLKRHIHQLVYYEIHPNAESAILREKNLKKLSRQTKFTLIEKDNRDWQDLSPKILG